MAGTQRKSDTGAKAGEDAPKLPDEVQPKPESEQAPVAAQVRPMDEQESAVTEKPEDQDAAFVITVDVPGIPRASFTDVKEGEHDPTLVSIPGLGAFRNGTQSDLSAEQMFLFLNHLEVTGVPLENLPLPNGVTIEEGK